MPSYTENHKEQTPKPTNHPAGVAQSPPNPTNLRSGSTQIYQSTNKTAQSLLQEDRGDPSIYLFPAILLPGKATSEHQGQTVKDKGPQDRINSSNKSKCVSKTSKIPQEPKKPCGSTISISQGISPDMSYGRDGGRHSRFHLAAEFGAHQSKAFGEFGGFKPSPAILTSAPFNTHRTNPTGSSWLEESSGNTEQAPPKARRRRRSRGQTPLGATGAAQEPALLQSSSPNSGEALQDKFNQ